MREVFIIMLNKNVRRQEAKEDLLFNNNHIASNLKKASATGGMVIIISQSLRFLIRMISTMVLARILFPSDFGLLAMVMAITNFATLFSSLGLSAATIQKREITHDKISALFWINAVFGLLVGIIIILISPIVSWFYGDSRLLNITITLSFTFMIRGLSVQHRALLTRNMRFLAIGIIDIIAMALGVIAAIISAVLGAEYWSLVIMYIVIAGSTTIAYWIAVPWKPSLPNGAVEVKEMLGFGGNITLYNIVNYFSRNMDNVLIGKLLGPIALGYYNRAYTLMMLPVGQLRQPLITVGMSALSKLQNKPEKFALYYLKLVRLLAFVAIPSTIFLGVYARQFILIFLGPDWLESVAVFKILSIAALVQVLTGTVGMVLVSSGDSRRYLRLGLLSAIISIISFIIGLRWGIIGVAVSYSSANIIFALPILYYAFKNTKISVRDYIRNIIIPFLSTCIMVIIDRLLYSLYYQIGEIQSLTLSCLIALILYFGIFSMIPSGRSIIRDVLDSIKIVFSKTEKYN